METDSGCKKNMHKIYFNQQNGIRASWIVEATPDEIKNFCDEHDNPNCYIGYQQVSISTLDSVAFFIEKVNKTKEQTTE